MAKNVKNEYVPDYVSKPGDTLLETINALDMSQAELAKRAGRPAKTINEIIAGKTKILPETAIQFEKVLGIPASFWNNRQRRYDEFVAAEKEQARLAKQTEWAKNFPVKTMMKYQWIPKTGDPSEILNHLLVYFSVASPKAWENHWNSVRVHFRKSATIASDAYALAAWLRKGEQIAVTRDCSPYNRQAFKNVLHKIRALTLNPPNMFCSLLVKLCASCGVAVAFVPHLPKTASGATRWINPSKALIQLSLKFGSDDHFWFSFFHEAGHILYHSKKSIFIESKDYLSFEESEANRFSADILVPPAEYRSFIKKGVFDKSSVLAFAEKLEISPGIVIGRLQHDGYLKYSELNDLKRRFTAESFDYME
jgi:HTH-type transcriptional regulator / antitoxin HigA